MKSDDASTNEHTVTNWFTILSTLLSLIFFALAVLVSSAPWTDLFLGMATSFVFLAVTNTIVRLQRWWSFRRVRDFFGSEIASQGLLLAYPDFVLSEAALERLEGTSDIWARPPVQISEGPALPHHDFPMEIKRSVAANDIQALLLFASVVEQNSAVAAALIEDRKIWTDSRRSFCAAGLTSNHCVALYAATDRDPLIILDPQNGHPVVHIPSGPSVVNNAQREFGIAMRFAPDREKYPNRRWWFVAGLGATGTPGAAEYLSAEWRRLSRLSHPDADFVAVVSLPLDTVHDPRLEYFVQRPAGTQRREVLFDSGYLNQKDA